MSPKSNTTIGNHTISNIVLYCLPDDINGPTASQENARDFLFQRNLLKSSMSCPGCNAQMTLVPCSTSKSPDGPMALQPLLEVEEHQSRQRPHSQAHFDRQEQSILPTGRKEESGQVVCSLSGRCLTVSRSNPNFWVLCNKRHAGISCFTVDPVSSSDTTDAVMFRSPRQSSTVSDRRSRRRRSSCVLFISLQTPRHLCPTLFNPYQTPSWTSQQWTYQNLQQKSSFSESILKSIP